MAVYVVLWLLFAFVAMLVGANKKAGPGGGFILGFLLGPLGVIITALSGEPTVLSRIEARPESPGWWPDPLGRFDSRWFDGHRWSQHVGRVLADGTRQQFEDPI